MSQIHPDNSNNGSKGRIFFAICFCLFLYGSYFYYLIRQQYNVLLERQSAFELIKVIAVPGTTFLKNMGAGDLFKSSLFFLILLGTLLGVFLVSSLLMRSSRMRAVYLLAGLLCLIVLTRHDRLHLSFSFVMCISFASFFLLTLSDKITFAPKEVLILFLSIVLITISLLYGSKRDFFLKARDIFLFDSSLGNKIISFYYANSPLATSLVSPERGIYQGLIFHEDIKGKRFSYFGRGLFLSGDEKIRHSADFVISKRGGQFSIANRYGKQKTIESVNPEAIEKSVAEMFSMGGFFHLTRVALYFFPAGLFILFLIGVKRLTNRRIVFPVAGVVTTLLVVSLILYTASIGNKAQEVNTPQSVDLSKQGLSIAYFLLEKKKIPGPYLPVLKTMAGSDKPVFRYWGAHLLGLLGDPNESQVLLKLIDDSQLNVRYRAAESLHRLLKEGSYQPLLTRLLQYSSWYVRCKIFSIFLKAGVIPSPA